ncbi:melatonin receptor [Branchiostoma belcheri]|nr:melatonin receptor [Branchiostoma belcheri]
MAAELELPRVVMMILVVILIVVGTIGNMSIILVISLTKDLWTTTNTFIINLAVADLFVTIIVDPYNAVGVRLRYYIDRESSNGKNTHSCINTGMPADGV